MFATDSRTENFLTHIGVKYEYVDSLPMDVLTPDWRTNNLGRQTAVDSDAVLEYGSLMENGSSAPAVIVMATPKGFVVLDGVQRLSASELNRETTFSAYVLDAKTSLAKQHLVRITANARINGQHTPDKSWILQQAVAVLYFEDNCSVQELSRSVGRPVADVEKEIRFQTSVQKMESVGYEGNLTRRKTHKWFASMIGKYAKHDDWSAAPEPIRQMLEILDECSFKNGNVEHLVKDFFDINRKTKDRHVQLTDKLRHLRDDPQVREKLKSGRKRTPLEDILPGLRRATTTLAKAVKRGDLVHDGGYAAEMAEQLQLIQTYCKALVPKEVQNIKGRKRSIFDPD